jgi:hypothetical protein
MKFRGGISDPYNGEFSTGIDSPAHFVATGSLASSEGCFPIRFWRCTEGFRFE